MPYSQSQGEFVNSKELLNAIEVILSDGLETFLYFGSPILWLKGDTVELPEKGSNGKTIAGDGENADAKFLVPNGSTDLQTVLMNQYSKTFFMQNRVAPLSFDELKGLGNMSGVALDRILIDPQIEATLNQKGAFGRAVQRMVWRN